MPFALFEKISLAFPENRAIIGKHLIWACSAVGSAPHSHCGGRRFESDQVHQKERHAAGRVFLFGVSPPKGRLHPPVITMLGGNEFRLRQGFGLRPKRLYGAKAPPHLVGPHVLCRHLSCCIVGGIGSNPIRSTIKAKQYRCRRPEAYGINCFRDFSARKFDDDSIDANHCFPLTGGIRTPSSQWLANPKPCGALFETATFKKGAIFLPIEYTKFGASICWS